MILQELKRKYSLSRDAIKSLKRLGSISEESVKQYYIDTYRIYVAAHVFINAYTGVLKKLAFEYEVSYRSLSACRGITVYDLYVSIIMKNKDWYLKELEIIRKYDIQAFLLRYVMNTYYKNKGIKLREIKEDTITDEEIIAIVIKYRKEKRRK